MEMLQTGKGKKHFHGGRLNTAQHRQCLRVVGPSVCPLHSFLHMGKNPKRFHTSDLESVAAPTVVSDFATRFALAMYVSYRSTRSVEVSGERRMMGLYGHLLPLYFTAADIQN